MKRLSLISTCLAILLVAAACASRATAPVAELPQVIDEPQAVIAPLMVSAAPEQEPQPAAMSDELPKGHPDIAEMLKARQQQKQQQAASGDLPAGHPDISQMQAPGGMNSGELPAGHPDISQMQAPAQANGDLPAGHPDISEMKAKKPATTQPGAKFGTVTIQAVQGTPGGPAVGNLPAVVELWGPGGKLVKKVETTLDASGIARLENVAIGDGVEPVVKVNYKGADYEAGNGILDGQNPEKRVQVAVYETTEQEPSWQVRLQHVMLEANTAVLEVSQVIVVHNPTDRAWIGKADADGKRSTVAIPVPAGASNLKFAGAFHDCCTKVVDGKAISSMPLPPGESEIQMAYTVPVSGGKVEYQMVAPVEIKHLMFFVPEDGSNVAAEGVELHGSSQMGGTQTRVYRVANLAAGAVVKFSISNVTAAPATASKGGATATKGAASAPAALPGASARNAKLLAGAGGLGIFLVGGIFLLVKSPKSSKRSSKAAA